MEFCADRILAQVVTGALLIGRAVSTTAHALGCSSKNQEFIPQSELKEEVWTPASRRFDDLAAREVFMAAFSGPRQGEAPQIKVEYCESLKSPFPALLRADSSPTHFAPYSKFTAALHDNFRVEKGTLQCSSRAYPQVRKAAITFMEEASRELGSQEPHKPYDAGIRDKCLKGIMLASTIIGQDEKLDGVNFNHLARILENPPAVRKFLDHHSCPYCAFWDRAMHVGQPIIDLLEKVAKEEVRVGCLQIWASASQRFSDLTARKAFMAAFSGPRRGEDLRIEIAPNSFVRDPNWVVGRAMGSGRTPLGPDLFFESIRKFQEVLKGSVHPGKNVFKSSSPEYSRLQKAAIDFLEKASNVLDRAVVDERYEDSTRCAYLEALAWASSIIGADARLDDVNFSVLARYLSVPESAQHFLQHVRNQHYPLRDGESIKLGQPIIDFLEKVAYSNVTAREELMAAISGPRHGEALQIEGKPARVQPKPVQRKQSEDPMQSQGFRNAMSGLAADILADFGADPDNEPPPEHGEPVLDANAQSAERTDSDLEISASDEPISTADLEARDDQIESDGDLGSVSLRLR
jgi:hypothetical protein